MKIRQVCICVMTMLHPMVLNAATKSLPTPNVVGFKPWYENRTGLGAFSGRLEAGSTITVDAGKLKYTHKFGLEYPEDVDGRIFLWSLDGQGVGNKSSYNLPDDSAGKTLKFQIIPSSKQGDPTKGNVLTITDFALAGVEGGTEDGKISRNKTAPTISNLRLVGTYQAGGTIKADYHYQANKVGKGGEEGDSRFQYGEKGTTANLDQFTSGNLNKIPEYLVTRSDIGKVIEVSVRPISKDNTEGNIYTSYADYDVPNSTPVRVDIDVDIVSNVKESSVAGNPIVGKSTLTAKLTLPDAKPGQPIFDSPELYHYTWSANGIIVQSGPGQDTYERPAVNLQGQQVVVSVTPGKTYILNN